MHLNWKRFSAFIVLIIGLIGFSCSGSRNALNLNNQPEIGKVLTNWQEGYLEIHAINTGRGESTFYILPDGTTILVDFSSSMIDPNHAIPPPARKPNDNISSGKAIANYIRHFLPATGHNYIDYAIISHFHPDHMGGYTADQPLGPSGKFRLTGITEIGSIIPYMKVLDRGYPNYDFPEKLSDPMMINYYNFQNWTKLRNNTIIEQFDVGSNRQISLNYEKEKYPTFQIQNVIGNGWIWTGGDAEGKKNILPDANTLVQNNYNENILSNGFLLKYGNFDYFTAGDLQYNGKADYPWKDIETPIASVVGKIDVLKANHHGTGNTNGDQFTQKLSPETVLIHPWRDVHPNPTTIQRFFTVNEAVNIFTTNMTDPNKIRLGNLFEQMKGTQGHIVLRVSPGGDEYYVYMLDDTNEKYEVKQIFGPYKSK